ncbi:hypothetical protein MHTCC0001_29910 [Flavobacteriaceae bacterium MHTCC 0001]
MKKLSILFFLLAIVSNCKNDDDNLTPLEQLPAATQTGEGSFGCLVNGTPFVETNNFLNAFYQFVNGKYFFRLGSESDENSILDQIIIGSNAAQIEDASEYNLRCNEEGFHYAEISVSDVVLGDENTTCETSFGILKITKLDFTNNIVSGTFEFDVEHPVTKEVIQVREGRFDTLFTE